MQKSIGSFLWERIEKKGIMKKRICKGVCSQSELSKLLSESKIPNYFIMERLFDRLGISTEKFEYILPQREYELCRLRYEIEKWCIKGRYKEVEVYLNEYKEMGKGEVLHDILEEN